MITLPSHTKSDVSIIFVSDSGAPHIKMSYSVNPRQSMSRLPTMQQYLTKTCHVVKSWSRETDDELEIPSAMDKQAYSFSISPWSVPECQLISPSMSKEAKCISCHSYVVRMKRDVTSHA
jgi:hypothetical protein